MDGARACRGDFGVSMEWQRPVSEVLGDRLWITVVVSFAALLSDLGAGTADRHLLGRAAILDRRLCLHTLGFIGLAVPNFLLALIILYLVFRWFGANVGGLFSAEYGAGALELGQGRWT